jgi:hypothetical protein
MSDASLKRQSVKEKSNSGVRRCTAQSLCHIMQRNMLGMTFLFMTIACNTSCSDKTEKTAASLPVAAPESNLPPIGSPADAPEYVRALSLLYPQAEIYRVENRIIQKSNHPLASIAEYYKKVLAKHEFTLTTRLEQTSGALLQFERKAEVISVDISKLPYADNFLIRIGRSEVDYNRGKSP